MVFLNKYVWILEITSSSYIFQYLQSQHFKIFNVNNLKIKYYVPSGIQDNPISVGFPCCVTIQKSSFLTGIAGGFYVHYNGAITPSILGVEQFLMTIAMMEIGGFGHFPGAALGALFIVFGSEYLRLAGTLRFTILGGLICTIILFFPGGLMGLIDSVDAWIGRFRRRGDPSA